MKNPATQNQQLTSRLEGTSPCKLLILNTGKLHSDILLGNFLLQTADLLAQEAQHSGVHFFRVRPSDGVRSILHDQLARSFDELGGEKACGRYGKDTVGIPLNHK